MTLEYIPEHPYYYHNGGGKTLDLSITRASKRGTDLVDGIRKIVVNTKVTKANFKMADWFFRTSEPMF